MTSRCSARSRKLSPRSSRSRGFFEVQAPPAERGATGAENEAPGMPGMSATAELVARYAPELRGFGASLPDEFAEALESLAGTLDAEQLERWAAQGVALAHHALRSWEAASEYFRASPALATQIDFETLMGWSDSALEL